MLGPRVGEDMSIIILFSYPGQQLPVPRVQYLRGSDGQKLTPRGTNSGGFQISIRAAEAAFHVLNHTCSDDVVRNHHIL